ncbi:MAG: hypothetical protein WCW31_01460 [Patescibacteria group bacterium]|jgi:hypothetical protein
MKATQLSLLCLGDALASRNGRHIRQATQALLNKCMSFFGKNPETTVQLMSMIRTLECAPEDPRVDTLPLMFYILHQRLDMVSRRRCNVENLVNIKSLMDDCALFYNGYRKANHAAWMDLLTRDSASIQAAA